MKIPLTGKKKYKYDLQESMRMILLTDGYESLCESMKNTFEKMFKMSKRFCISSKKKAALNLNCSLKRYMYICKLQKESFLSSEKNTYEDILSCFLSILIRTTFFISYPNNKDECIYTVNCVIRHIGHSPEHLIDAILRSVNLFEADVLTFSEIFWKVWNIFTKKLDSSLYLKCLLLTKMWTKSLSRKERKPFIKAAKDLSTEFVSQEWINSHLETCGLPEVGNKPTLAKCLLKSLNFNARQVLLKNFYGVDWFLLESVSPKVNEQVETTTNVTDATNVLFFEDKDGELSHEPKVEHNELNDDERLRDKFEIAADVLYFEDKIGSSIDKSLLEQDVRSDNIDPNQLTDGKVSKKVKKKKQLKNRRKKLALKNASDNIVKTKEKEANGSLIDNVHCTKLNKLKDETADIGNRSTSNTKKSRKNRKKSRNISINYEDVSFESKKTNEDETSSFGNSTTLSVKKRSKKVKSCQKKKVRKDASKSNENINTKSNEGAIKDSLVDALNDDPAEHPESATLVITDNTINKIAEFKSVAKTTFNENDMDIDIDIEQDEISNTTALFEKEYINYISKWNKSLKKSPKKSPLKVASSPIYYDAIHKTKDENSSGSQSDGENQQKERSSSIQVDLGDSDVELFIEKATATRATNNTDVDSDCLSGKRLSLLIKDNDDTRTNRFEVTKSEKSKSPKKSPLKMVSSTCETTSPKLSVKRLKSPLTVEIKPVDFYISNNAKDTIDSSSYHEDSDIEDTSVDDSNEKNNDLRKESEIAAIRNSPLLHVINELDESNDVKVSVNRPETKGDEQSSITSTSCKSDDGLDKIAGNNAVVIVSGSDLENNGNIEDHATEKKNVNMLEVITEERKIETEHIGLRQTAKEPVITLEQINLENYITYRIFDDGKVDNEVVTSLEKNTIPAIEKIQEEAVDEEGHMTNKDCDYNKADKEAVTSPTKKELVDVVENMEDQDSDNYRTDKAVVSPTKNSNLEVPKELIDIDENVEGNVRDNNEMNKEAVISEKKNPVPEIFAVQKTVDEEIVISPRRTRSTATSESQLNKIVETPQSVRKTDSGLKRRSIEPSRRCLRSAKLTKTSLRQINESDCHALESEEEIMSKGDSDMKMGTVEGANSVCLSMETPTKALRRRLKVTTPISINSSVKDSSHITPENVAEEPKEQFRYTRSAKAKRQIIDTLSDSETVDLEYSPKKMSITSDESDSVEKRVEFSVADVKKELAKSISSVNLRQSQRLRARMTRTVESSRIKPVSNCALRSSASGKKVAKKINLE